MYDEEEIEFKRTNWLFTIFCYVVILALSVGFIIGVLLAYFILT